MKKSEIQKVKNQIMEWSFKAPSIEICGFVGWNETNNCLVVEKGTNIAKDPRNFFTLNPVEYLNFKMKNQLVAIFHSHIIGDENPSEFDIRMSESCCAPFLIFGLNSKKFHLYVPQTPESDVKIINRFKEKL